MRNMKGNIAIGLTDTKKHNKMFWYSLNKYIWNLIEVDKFLENQFTHTEEEIILLFIKEIESINKSLITMRTPSPIVFTVEF